MPNTDGLMFEWLRKSRVQLQWDRQATEYSLHALEFEHVAFLAGKKKGNPPSVRINEVTILWIPIDESMRWKSDWKTANLKFPFVRQVGRKHR